MSIRLCCANRLMDGLPLSPCDVSRLSSRDGSQRGFVSAVGGGTEASVAEFIVNPLNTVLQGTVIEASVE